MSPKLKSSLDSFRQLDLPNFLINIWSYSDPLFLNNIKPGV